MTSRRWFITILAILALGLGSALAWLAFDRPYSFQGSLIASPQPASDFTLTDQNGRPFRLSAQRGSVVLLFFGYTNCPDVCPATLTEYKQLRVRLGDQASDVRFLFVTVDPDRDTVARLREHLSLFDPSITGLTGDGLDAVWQAYGIVRQIRQDSTPGDGAGGAIAAGVGAYSVDHTARLFVIDRQGNLRLTYPFGFPLQGILEDVQHLLRE
jgi:protein SCO1